MTLRTLILVSSEIRNQKIQLLLHFKDKLLLVLSSTAGGIKQKNPEVAENKGEDTGLNYSVMLPQDHK